MGAADGVGEEVGTAVSVGVIELVDGAGVGVSPGTLDPGTLAPAPVELVPAHPASKRSAATATPAPATRVAVRAAAVFGALNRISLPLPHHIARAEEVRPVEMKA
ncbi:MULTISPECIES: hypothetical protein [Subtercola]|uniref:Uncharacterized protein n=1 Tax=Subtercola vilae TaxID=2056433 RepID=A0A4T2C6Q1_9MICO|nr:MULTISPECIES: hypothetical protein [Subtercola]MEA9984792.1 hypothetical protein [Subtercola sp. RTI3]TIH38981.1 hypothetical protein D4765_05270 [Subtercola vilae]